MDSAKITEHVGFCRGIIEMLIWTIGRSEAGEAVSFKGFWIVLEETKNRLNKIDQIVEPKPLKKVK